MQKPKKDVLYINICSWTRIPKPKTNTDPISVSAGPVEDEADDTGKKLSLSLFVCEFISQDKIGGFRPVMGTR